MPKVDPHNIPLGPRSFRFFQRLFSKLTSINNAQPPLTSKPLYQNSPISKS